jgi:predicted nucleic acid-binding protein
MDNAGLKVAVDANLVVALVLPLPYSLQATHEAMHRILDLQIRCLPPTRELHDRALWWAERLGRNKTYDTHYVALAEQQQVELWTADRRLVNAAGQAGASWVRWMGEP